MLLRILFMLVFVNAYSQDETLASGIVSFDNEPLTGVIIRNYDSNQNAATDAKGIFKIRAKVGDALYFYYVGMKDVSIMVTKSILESNSAQIKMQEYSTKIEEVVVDKDKMDAVSMGILQQKAKSYTTNERRLKTAGDFKPIHLLGILGGGLAIDPILNAINGKTKMLKNGIKYEKNSAVVEYLKTNFYDYIKNNLKIESDEEIMKFCYYIAEVQPSAEITKNKDIQTKFYLSNAIIDYHERLKAED